MSPEDAADAYIAAFDAVGDPAEVRRIVARGFTSDAEIIGTQTGAGDTARGQAEIAEWILRRGQGIRLNLRTSPVDAHHGWLRFEWRFETASGGSGDGVDVGHQADDGRLDLLIAFSPLHLPRL